LLGRMGQCSLPFYSRAFTRYVFLQGLQGVSLFLLCISSMTDPDAVYTMHNRAVSCNLTRVSERDCAAAARALGKPRLKEILIWTQHLSLGLLSCFSGSICILAWAAHAETWQKLEGQRVVYWCAPFVACLVLLVHVFLALFLGLYLRCVYLWFAVMTSALVMWDGFHFAASMQELVVEPTQPSEDPPSVRTPIKAPNSLRLTAKSTVPQKATVPPKGTVPPKSRMPTKPTASPVATVPQVPP
ncbi:hypothetical protein PRIPAC_73554, partial [Pristionchus pacificus]